MRDDAPTDEISEAAASPGDCDSGGLAGGTSASPSSRAADAVEAKGLRRRFLEGAFWSVAGNAAAAALRLPAAVVVARVLGSDHYGALGMINGTVGMFDNLARFRLGATATKHVAEFRRDAPERAGRVMALTTLVGGGLGAVVSVVVLVFANRLAAGALDRPELGPLLAASSVLLLFSGIAGPQNGALAGFEAFRAIATVTVVFGAASTLLRIGGALTWGLEGVVWATILATAIQIPLARRALRVESERWGVRPQWRGCLAESRVLWRYSLPATLSALMVGPVMWGASALLARTEGGYERLGVFNAAFQWQILASNAPQALGAVLVPMLSAHAGENRPRLETLNILAGWSLVAIVALPIVAFPDVVQALYGRSFEGESFRRALTLVMLFTCVEAYNGGIARKLQARDLMWWGVAANAVWAALLLGSTWMLRDRGAEGLAAAYAIAYTLKTALFAPFHVSRGVVPARLMFGPSVALVWVGFGVAAAASLAGADPWTRGAAALVGATACARGFATLVRRGR